MKRQISKFFPDKSKKNIVVKVDFLAGKKIRHECVGVLMRESAQKIRIGFNAKDDVVVDYLDIDTDDLIDIKEIPEKEIAKIF